MISSGYSLVLYCDDPDHIFEASRQYGEFDDERKDECWKNARKAGWILKSNRECICPICAKRRKLK